MKKRVSIVEDNLDYQTALKQLIQDSGEFELAQIFSSAEEAKKQVFQDPPDILLVDIQLPGMSGIEFIGQIRTADLPVQCLVCSMHEDDDSIVRALENGATGYILKTGSATDILQALIDVAKGGAPMSPYVARRVVSFFQKPKLPEVAALISDREQEVLQLLAKGLQYKEIAAQLNISTETVKKHLKNIYQKLHVQNKVEALNKLRML
jgi:two-component system, NarL family, response regulator LiaR